jgi:hypothetical protein
VNDTARLQDGMSSLEVITMALIMSVLMIMVTESMGTLSGVRSEQRAHFRLDDTADSVASRIKKDIDVAERVFSSSTEDSDYLRAMDFGFDPLAEGARLPKLTTYSYFGPDPISAPETGNILFVARRGPRIAVKWNEAITEFLVQSLSFTVWLPIGDAGHLDLMRWVSEPIVNYWDVHDIDDERAKTDVLSQLYENGIRIAWDPTSPRATGLFEITAAGGLVQIPADRPIPGAEDRAASRPFARRQMQLAPNGTGGEHRVPLYARESGAFPGGFEIKIDGASAGKLLLLRLVARTKPQLARQVSTEIRRYYHTQG